MPTSSLVFVATALLAAAAGTPSMSAREVDRVDDASANAFGYPLSTLTAAERRAFVVGNSFFKQNWVTAPSSTAARDGLGPLFNARSCSTCHVRDGRSAPPSADAHDRSGVLIRLGVRNGSEPDAPHPIYGSQVQDVSVLGVRPEARVETRWHARTGSYGDGATFELLEPEYELVDLGFGAMGQDVSISPRTAPHLVGLGLLEAIPAAAILARADPDDIDGNGISGRAHFVPAPDGNSSMLGRFGWKAAQPDVRSQTAAALRNDMGITSALEPDEPLTSAQRQLVEFTSGGSPEIDASAFDRLVLYTRTLAVPAVRGANDARVGAGRALFDGFGCANCHVPSWTTDAETDLVRVRGQRIHPFTDLLLHDMGPELADGSRDGDAGPAEWRTPPLWGIGLIPVVNGHTRYLHDGRARNLTEAVLWHGGEAHAARERFRTSSAAERDALIAFLESL